MANYTPTDSADLTSFIVSKTTDSSVINTYMLGQTNYKMVATAVTTCVEFRGLTRSEALSMATNSNYNYLSKHGVRFTSGSSFMAMPECEGTECRADARRMNEADMWRVVVTHVSTTVTHSGGWIKATF